MYSRATTEREVRRIRCMAVAHRTASAAEVKAFVDPRVTQQTVTNRLFEGQLRVRRPVLVHTANADSLPSTTAVVPN